jgi:CubicO group peptidase (beta-lactamase class C family)
LHSDFGGLLFAGSNKNGPFPIGPQSVPRGSFISEDCRGLAMLLKNKTLPGSLLALCFLSLLASPPVFSAKDRCQPGVYQPDLFVLAECSGDEAVLETLIHPMIHAQTIGMLLQRAIDDGLIAGGVALTGNSTGILSVSARGKLNKGQDAPRLDEETIFDLASLTKVVATAPAVMKLVEDGQISLLDPLTRWFPEFRGSRHAKIKVIDLLTHTSGLEDVQLRRGQAIESIVRKAVAERSAVPPGSRFSYADINFMLLGEMVRRVSGKTLDVFCQQELYGPLEMKQTMFLPPRELKGVIAATEGSNSGVVQDPNARRLGRVAGHAGLFSSTRDLSRYARFMLNGGELEGKRVISASLVAEMISPHAIGKGAVKRGLGWDIESPFSAPKSTLFSVGSFGHTGYSGSSIWIDPREDLYVILLTIRRSYRHPSYFNRLRRDVSTIAAAEFGRLEEVREEAVQGAVSKIARKLSEGEGSAASRQPLKPTRLAGRGVVWVKTLQLRSGKKMKKQTSTKKKRRRSRLSV